MDGPSSDERALATVRPQTTARSLAIRRGPWRSPSWAATKYRRTPYRRTLRPAAAAARYERTPIGPTVAGPGLPLMAETFDGTRGAGLPQRWRSKGHGLWLVPTIHSIARTSDGAARFALPQRRKGTGEVPSDSRTLTPASRPNTNRRPEIRRDSSRWPAVAATKVGRAPERFDGNPRVGLPQRRRCTGELTAGWAARYPARSPTTSVRRAVGR